MPFPNPQVNWCFYARWQLFQLSEIPPNISISPEVWNSPRPTSPPGVWQSCDSWQEDSNNSFHRWGPPTFPGLFHQSPDISSTAIKFPSFSRLAVVPHTINPIFSENFRKFFLVANDLYSLPLTYLTPHFSRISGLTITPYTVFTPYLTANSCKFFIRTFPPPIYLFIVFTPYEFPHVFGVCLTHAQHESLSRPAGSRELSPPSSPTLQPWSYVPTLHSVAAAAATSLVPSSAVMWQSPRRHRWSARWARRASRGRAYVTVASPRSRCGENCFTRPWLAHRFFSIAPSTYARRRHRHYLQHYTLITRSGGTAKFADISPNFRRMPSVLRRRRVLQSLHGRGVSVWNLRFSRVVQWCLQCFDTVGWVPGRACGMWKLSNEVLVWLFVGSEVQTVCIWSSWCHCHPKTPSSLASFKSRLVLPLWCQLAQVVLDNTPLNV